MKFFYTELCFSLYIYIFILLAEAVPEKILDLMDDENLTRENVASHLEVFFLSLIFSIRS